MRRCVETVRIVDGLGPGSEALAAHQERVDRTCRELYGSPAFDLEAALKAAPVPDSLRSGTVKCRVAYGPEGVSAVEYAPYAPLRIESLLAVEDDRLEYRFKYLDRARLTYWFERAAREGFDDALLIRKGSVTDATRCNAAFRTTGNPAVWHTPAEPLLRGTMRERLLRRGIVAERDIPAEALTDGRYDRIALFNALNDFGSLTIPIRNVVPATRVK